MPPVAGVLAAAASAAKVAIGAVAGFSIGGVAVGSIALNLAASLILSAVAQRLSRRRIRAEDIKRELSEWQSRPAKRFVYGRTRVVGTPAPIRVDGRDLYMCLILNSRPSAAEGVTVYFDGRAAQVVAGDMFDFAGPGATLEPVESGQSFGSGADRPRVWMGRGDQIGPPLELLGLLAGAVVRWDFEEQAVFAPVLSVALTIDGTQYEWTTASAFGGAFVPVGNTGGFLVTRASRKPFAVEVSHPVLTEFEVQAATCLQVIIVGVSTTHVAVDLGMPDGTQLRGSDGWRGLTVMWVRVNSGPPESRLDRWPATPPLVEVEADWSRVWDPRDPAQDADDPDTWQYSNNQALCLLDAVLHNPIRKRPRFTVNVDSFTEAADIADQPVARFHAGGTVPRYTANGVLVWSTGEIMDQISPLAEAGGGDLVQTGGVLGYVAPIARTPAYQITDFLQDGGFEFTRLVPGSELPAAVRVSYVNPDRNWSQAELPALAVGAGSSALGDDGIFDVPLPFVTEPTQAMRIQRIIRNRLAAQRRLRLTLPPDAIDLAGGAVAQWAIADLPRCAGLWRVISIAPAAWLEGDGVALRCPVELAEEPPNVDFWDPAIHEVQLATETFTPPAPVRVPPEDLSATTGPGVTVGATPRIRFSFLPVDGNVTGYEWQWREAGGDYAEGGTISDSVRDTSGRVFGFLVPVLPGVDYQIRVRTIYLSGISDWVDVTITAQGPDFALDPPGDGQALGGAGEIEISFLTPNNTAFEAIEFWGGDSADLSAAVLLDTIASAANTVRTLVEGGLGGSATRYYWARSRGPFGAVSAFSGSVSATTDAATQLLDLSLDAFTTAPDQFVTERDPLRLIAVLSGTSPNTSRGGWSFESLAGVVYRVTWDITSLQATPISAGALVRVTTNPDFANSGDVIANVPATGPATGSETFTGTGGVIWVGPSFVASMGQGVQINLLQVSVD